MPDHFNDSELFELFQTYQVHAHSRASWKYHKNESRFSYRRYFIEKTIIAKPVDHKFSNNEKQKVLTWRNTLLKQVKSYIDNNLNPSWVNVIDSIKGNITPPLSVKKIWHDLKISKDDYYRVLSIWKGENFELHFKSQSNSSFVNIYFDVGFKAWQANMDILGSDIHVSIFLKNWRSMFANHEARIQGKY